MRLGPNATGGALHRALSGSENDDRPTEARSTKNTTASTARPRSGNSRRSHLALRGREIIDLLRAHNAELVLSSCPIPRRKHPRSAKL